MADTFYGLQSLATGTGFLAMQEGGTAPTAGAFSPNTGWRHSSATVNVPTGESAEMDSQGMVGVTTFTPNSTTAKPLAPNNTLGNAFRTPTTKTGTYPAGNWTMRLEFIAVTNNVNGRFEARIEVYKAASATGATPTKLTTSPVVLGPTTATLFTTTPTALTTAWAAPEVVLDNEYLFFCVAVRVTTASTGTSVREANLYGGANTAMTTTDFVPAGAGMVQSVGMVPI